MISADNEFARFKQLAEAVGLSPLPLELQSDRFYRFNPEKRRRGKLVFRFVNQQRTLSVFDFNGADGKPFNDIMTKKLGSNDTHGVTQHPSQ